MFSFHCISVLLINVTFYTYLASIIFLCDLAFKVEITLICIKFGADVINTDKVTSHKIDGFVCLFFLYTKQTTKAHCYCG